MVLQSTGIEIVQEFMSSDYVGKITIELIDKTVIIATILAVFLFILMLGWNYLKNGFESLTGGKPEMVNYNELVRTIVIVVCIFCYKPVITTVADITDYFNMLSAPSSQEYQQMINAKNKLYELSSGEQQELAALKSDLAAGNLKGQNIQIVKNRIAQLEGGAVAQALDTDIESEDPVSYWNPFKWKTMLLHFIATGLFGIIKIIISIMAGILFQFMMVVGPLALAFSIIPVFRNQIDTWFGTLINTAFIGTTYNILDHFHNAMFIELGKDSSLFALDSTTMETMEFALLILYLMPFFLTSKFVGKGDGGRFVSKSLQLATIAAAGALGGAAGASAGSGGAEKGKAVKDILDASKDAMGEGGDQ